MLFKLRVECAVSSVNMDSSTDRNMKRVNKRSLCLILCYVKGAAPVSCVIIYKHIFIIYMRRFLT